MNVIPTEGKPIKHWTEGVLFEEEAQRQLKQLATLPFIYKHIAVMPDVHAGIGSTIGTVLATKGAIIPAAVGVDIGCGMMACKTSLLAKHLPDNLSELRSLIESRIPHGSVPGSPMVGSWGIVPEKVNRTWIGLEPEFMSICERHPIIAKSNNRKHLGTLGGGNHFIEICLDEQQSVWFMLHSGSRGVGNLIGRTFIELAKKDMQKYFINLPDKDMAYLPNGSEHFISYIKAVNWAQEFASANRKIMMDILIGCVGDYLEVDFESSVEAINCHHNYVGFENHFDNNVWVTRKGAVSAKKGQMGIIPGSMGAKSFIVRGLGNEQSFHSCSHGAGRVMSRTKAKQLVDADIHAHDLQGVECRKDASTIDETPSAYKNIDDVMHAQRDLVEIVHTLKQVLCVKG